MVEFVVLPGQNQLELLQQQNRSRQIEISMRPLVNLSNKCKKLFNLPAFTWFVMDTYSPNRHQNQCQPRRASNSAAGKTACCHAIWVSFGMHSMKLSPFTSTKSWRVMAVGSTWCSRNERMKLRPMNVSTVPQVSAPQWTRPELKSAARMPRKAANSNLVGATCWICARREVNRKRKSAEVMQMQSSSCNRFPAIFVESNNYLHFPSPWPYIKANCRAPACVGPQRGLASPIRVFTFPLGSSSGMASTRISPAISSAFSCWQIAAIPEEVASSNSIGQIDQRPSDWWLLMLPADFGSIKCLWNWVGLIDLEILRLMASDWRKSWKNLWSLKIVIKSSEAFTGFAAKWMNGSRADKPHKMMGQ